MIKETELRIGNIVFSNVTKKQLVIGGLFTDCMIDCEPIALTKEWLLKFGLKPMNGGHQFNMVIKKGIDKDVLIAVDLHGWFGISLDELVYKGLREGINNVHELQNLCFFLTGEELVVSPSKNDFKKVLYREKPIANRQKVRSLPKTHLHYHCMTSLGEVKFKIPLDESEGFEDQMDGKLLIRWMQ